MKCENCRFLRTEGYEYPETYCGAGVAEDDERVTSDGCSYHYKTLEKRERELDEAWVYCYLVKYRPGTDMKFWPQVRKMLNTYCEYHLADDEVLIFNVNGIDYFISDVGLRMLSPKELYRAQGFPSDYVIDVDYKGNAYSRSAQVARCGNAVCPPMATALVRANFPEWCGTTICTMADLFNKVAI